MGFHVNLGQCIYPQGPTKSLRTPKAGMVQPPHLPTARIGGGRPAPDLTSGELPGGSLGLRT